MGYVALHVMMTVNNELGKKYYQVYFKLLSQHLFGWTMKTRTMRLYS
jgi:hypothetical protein